MPSLSCLVLMNTAQHPSVAVQKSRVQCAACAHGMLFRIYYLNGL